jgi:hypothetical protein
MINNFDNSKEHSILVSANCKHLLSPKNGKRRFKKEHFRKSQSN